MAETTAQTQETTTIDPASVILDIQDLYVGYYEDLNILQGVDIKVQQAKITTILGANGVGKSTLLKAIFGFLKPNGGQVMLEGADVVGTAIVYDSHSYPYFFTDTNADGEPSPDEANYGNRYGTWTPRLLRAAYNYQYAAKDPGGFAHNGKYIIQTLYDALEDLGADVSGFVRP